MTKLLLHSSLFACLSIAMFPTTSTAQTAEIGIDRSNLTRQSEAVQERTLQDIHALHATWFRDVLSAGTPQNMAAFVNEVRLAKKNGLKFLANVLPSAADYDNPVNENAGEDFRKRCGWAQGSSKLTQINLAKFAERMRAQLNAVKAANLTIDAFEIGNEADWICFNGDAPNGHEPTQADWMTAVRGYAHFLKAAAEVIRDPHYFPTAKIITFGIAHGSDRWDKPPHHFSNPARMVALLKNLDGSNYLDNAIYHVDGYGTHIYPYADNLEQSVTDLIRQDAAILGPDKPFWITEWGLSANAYPNKKGQTRADGIRDFYTTLDKLHLPFGPVFYYAYDLLIDAKGMLWPEASAVTARARPGNAETRPPAGAPCLECVKVRVGLPRVARGPAVDIGDNHFTEVQLPDGRFRGFDAHGETRVIDGDHPWDMGGAARIVLSRGKPGTYNSCGQWLNHVESAGKTLLGFIHDETACRYDVGQTHKSMSLGISTDYGLTWKSYGQIITGMDAPKPNKNTGEGDCTAVNGQDGYYYCYCTRNKDGGLIVARAPVSDPGPGKWMKFFQGKWDQPGLGGDATSLGNGSGHGVARWTTTGATVMTGFQKGGMGLFFSTDDITFTSLREPLLALDPGVWKRPDPSEVLAYPGLLDAKTGANQLSNSWMLVYAYWPPYEAAAKKYLVFRDVEVSVSNSPVTPQVGVLLARWCNSALHDRWSTTAAVPGNYTDYKLEAKSGYLMTVADPAKPSLELEDCVSERPGHPDHLLAEKGFCEAHQYQRLRTAGWVYSQVHQQTIPIYRCYNEQDHSHFASNKPDCEKLGTMERLLGYGLSQ